MTRPLPIRVRFALFGAAAVDSIGEVLRARRLIVLNDRGRPTWPGPVRAGDGPADDHTIWVASISYGGTFHRWDHPDACMASTARRGGWTMPAGKAASWLGATPCPRCWPSPR